MSKITSNGSLDLSLDINIDEAFEKNLKKAQEYVDGEVIRRSAPYTPFVTGKLEQSATLGTKIGSGKIVYASIYARFQYYGKVMISPTTGSSWALPGEKKILTDRDLQYNQSQHELAGSFWFERMKKDNFDDIKKGAQKIITKGKK